MDVIHKDLVAILLRPSIAQIDHGACVSVSAANGVGLAVAAMWRRAQIMQMVGNRRQIFVDVWIEVLARLAMITCALNDMEQMWDHTTLHEPITVVVVVDAPLIAAAPGKDFKLMSRWMIAPNRRVQRFALVIGRPRLSDFGMREDTVTSVQRAVGPPGKTVQGLVRVLVSLSIKQDLWLTVGNIIRILIRNEHKKGCRADPHAAKADLDPGNKVQPVHEHLLGFE